MVCSKVACFNKIKENFHKTANPVGNLAKDIKSQYVKELLCFQVKKMPKLLISDWLVIQNLIDVYE